ncbi:MAG TPA: thiaminase II [Candidatus Binataceae bacterium]|nr:thiaminase II [Candidatus Binataceae bacterium]
MATGSFSSMLREKAADIWIRELEHPFVRGLGDGTLPVDRFRFYLEQDYLFLIEYCRVFALASAKAHDRATMELFAGLLGGTLKVEMQLHRDYCKRLGIEAAELEEARPAPVTHAYTRHLLTAAYSGTITGIIAAVLPCQLGYVEIATALAREGRGGGNSFYAEWISTYTSREFIEGAQQLVKLLDTLAEGLPARETTHLESLFLTSSRYEYLFWEMSWTRATWPV